ncbi:MAG: riboflavin biosynthesis protein RibF [Elusimicrobiaceae bacterium]|nr:riboflavin biosynthesis protein RibF [Elusimicrobiaceae bacterium]
MKKKIKNFITVGTFDGVHTGHRFLLSRLEILAAKYRQKPLALYFQLPPKTLMGSKPEMTVLTLPREKKQLLRRAGTPAFPLDFATCRNLTANQFFTKILLRQYHMGGMIVGADFALGKNRQAGADWLKEQCQLHQIPFETVRFYKTGTQKISSSLIRKILASGDIERANLLLGHPYELTGKVIKGQQLGRKLGFPTANLNTGIYKILPLGVFAVKVRVGKEIYDGFCNIGFRPTINTISGSLPLVEVHIFNFNQDIYNQNITIWFASKLRDETKFDLLPNLVAQLKKDRKEAQKILRRFHL